MAWEESRACKPDLRFEDINGQCSKPLSCQMHEATEIECSKAHVLLNSKGEYNGHRVPWVAVEVGSRVLTQEYRGSHQRQQGQPGLQGWACESLESLEDHPAEDTRSSNTRIEETGSTTSTTLDLTTDSRTQQVLEWESQVRKSGCMMKTKVEKRSGWETIMDTQRKNKPRYSDSGP